MLNSLVLKRSKLPIDSKGFTMIELLMVISLVAILGATALPSFLDFRTEAKIAALRSTLSTMRAGIKNQIQQARLRCARAGNLSLLDIDVGFPFYDGIYAAALRNDITFGYSVPRTVCTTAQVPDANDRKFWTLETSQMQHFYSSGVDSGSYSVPTNPFITPNSALHSGTVLGTSIINLQNNYPGGVCAMSTSFAQPINGGPYAVAWISVEDTVYAGTNTPGINECNF